MLFMKKIILLFLGLWFYQNGWAQKGQKVIGFNLGSVFPAGGKFDQFNQELPDLANISGVFFDWNFSRQAGISVAANYQFSTQIRKDLCFICLENPDYRYYYADLQVPVNVALNLARKQIAAWKTYFLIGYTFSYQAATWRKNLETNGGLEFLAADPYWLNNSSHFINVGLDIRHTFGTNFSLGISPFARVLLSNETGLPYFGLNLKAGKVL